ncbi:phosphoribosylformylglycinamidine synthase [Desulfuribacillus alkaliarsenatis]|uniref:Phosphoribosylformylglycinamidine synthase n=1 Tax=Desulfuribacillus alkaliarsenatis TaxID=766136 RepID=A0A1E5G1C5_9FIRM|nr:phosphoribosylformylglycinamidine synthase [Desulfuribacillus alkaliarsenatis]OEF96719.1 phosphoribosylformylglycinamidine synthase [Desulfuribacillus alkaliarsenatis]
MVNNDVRRIYVEKKPGFDIEAQKLAKEFVTNLNISELKKVRAINRYDVSGMDDATFAQAKNTIFSEPPVDTVYEEEYPLPEGAKVFAVEFLPGQYDQRADSAAQCVQLLTQGDRPNVNTARVIVLEGNITEADVAKIKDYYINPVESREAKLEKPTTLEMVMDEPKDVAIIDGFVDMDDQALKAFMDDIGFAMNYEDLKFCQEYFRDTEKRNPTITELKVIDTYWSDHCRHTTFMTEITDVQIDKSKLTEPIEQAYKHYINAREAVYGSQERAMCLMDMAVIGMKELRKLGKLDDLDASEEINACSIVVNVDVDGENQEWLVMFKNETHNHPTEIEPFGGAATCLGGCIRDPLSGRSYVYQAMRVTGSGDPRTKIEDTLPGKLPQRKITTEAAAGYSSYGNQIGLATGHVAEVYDEGFIAKRMEIGAVVAAAPKENVVRERPAKGDVVILAGGRTGRDGCGGATGSSKEHDEDSLFSCGAEVQKGNPPTERKIQRLFRKPEVSQMIKKCNDFGAGGVSVAIGELTDGLEINLDVIPKKYEGLDGTELAISESQERMAVVVAAENAERFIELAKTENVEATVVAEVTDSRRLQMFWRGNAIVDISRDFLDTNGVKQATKVHVQAPDEQAPFFATKSSVDLKQQWLNNLQDLNVCSQKGLVERFDSSIGAGTVLMPFGGKHQATPTEGMVAKIPVLKGETSTATIMTHGYNPKLSKWSPFHGAMYAVVEAVAKVVAIGGSYEGIRLTLQEYFEKLGTDETKWGKPFSALLGAYLAQKEFGIPAIGGKDSMSGTFKDIHVPPTLVAFAVAVVNAANVISPELKQAGSQLVLVKADRDEQGVIDFAQLKTNFATITKLIEDGSVLAAHTVKYGGLAEAVSKMTFGNKIGVSLQAAQAIDWFSPDYGSIVLEMPADINVQAALGDANYQVLGQTIEQPEIRLIEEKDSTEAIMQILIADLYKAWEQPLENIFPTKTASINSDKAIEDYSQEQTKVVKSTALARIAKPRIVIPVFPGTNCEYDTQKVFEQAGGLADTLIIRNLTASDIEESVAVLVDKLSQAQIMMLPGGFSGGDEPDGSGKFYATLFRNPRIKEATMELLQKRDGLILGICNGFQALIKLGLLPHGEIREMTPESPTLTYNTIGRHISCMAMTKVVSDKSPWFNNVQVGDMHNIPFSHGEGRFVAPEDVIQQLAANGQIATQYVDEAGQPTYDIRYNPNGSMFAIEGITSPDGRILGKMGHSERIGKQVGINTSGNKDQQLFNAGVRYFQ